MPNLLRQLMMQNRLMEGEPSDPGSSAPPPTPAPTKGPEMFSREYVTELRQENASYRTRAIEAEKKAQEAADAAKKVQEEAEARVKKATDDAEAKVKDTHTTSEKRIIMAELKASALKAGMVDLDGLKLADLSGITIDEKGEIQGATELMAALKESKPYLFKEPTSSTTHAGDPPPKKKAEPFDARKATPEEVKAKAREMGIKIKQ
ncbi:hypothetical protein [Paraburkholderia tropica]|uniref:phage scaffolding protein n=1 Tax=Paraburkholderia tropica TaxID=92647 RepID=UPI003D28B70D